MNMKEFNKQVLRKVDKLNELAFLFGWQLGTRGYCKEESLKLFKTHSIDEFKKEMNKLDENI